MKFGKILVSIYQPGSAAILNSIPGLEVIEGLGNKLNSLLDTTVMILTKKKETILLKFL